jgi:hypothetical protein
MFREFVNKIQKHRNYFILAVACLVGLSLGTISVFLSSFWVLLGLLGLGAVILSLFKPEIGVLLILVTTSTIVFEEKLPLIPIGIGSLNIPDVFFLGLLGWILIRILVEKKFKIVHTPIDLPLLVFLGLIVISTFLAMYKKDITYSTGIRGIREISYLATFFIVTNLIRKKEQFKLLFNGLIFLTIVVALAMVAQFILGSSVSLFPGRIESLYTQGETFTDITRVLPPGQSLIMVMFIVLVVLLMINKKDKPQFILIGEVGLIGLAVVITFNRNFWVSIIAAMAVFAVVIGWKIRAKLIRWSVIIFLSIVVFLTPFMVFAPTSKLVRVVSAAVERLSTISSTQVVNEGSIQFRIIEMEYAIPVIASHPFLGIGLGNNYRPFDNRLDSSTSDWRYLIHNSHFWLIMMSGWFGYLCFAWFSFSVVYRGLKHWESIPDPFEKAIVLGFSLAYIGVLIGSLVNPIFQQWFWTGLLGVLWGMNEVILKDRAKNRLALEGIPVEQ